jgi:shikimate 5-dehydrogenase
VASGATFVIPATERERTMQFVGVSTGSSSILTLFPRWASVLGLGRASVVGRDLALDAPPRAYRDVVQEIRRDPSAAGALVTTHKLAVLAAAPDLFDELDPFARLTREVSCISKRDGRLVGHAKDPITAGRALAELVGERHFRSSGAHVLCLGAGGAGTAILLHLLTLRDPRDRPDRVVMVDADQRRLDALRELERAVGPHAGDVAYELSPGPLANDRLLAALPPGSLVVNATGMGKDRPGSPLTDAARFPMGAVVWELNYRGDLDFLRQARAQSADCRLAVHDGWAYFLHGWSEAIAEVFSLELTPRRLADLRAAADRPA